jgi:hypothetical protein
MVFSAPLAYAKYANLTMSKNEKSRHALVFSLGIDEILGIRIAIGKTK